MLYKKFKKYIYWKKFEDESYKFSDEYENKRGKYNLKQPLDCNSISYSPSLDYPIEHDGVTYYPGSDYEKYLSRKRGIHQKNDYAWRWSKELYEFGLKNGWIVFKNGRIYTKGYLNATVEKNKSNGKYEIVYRYKTRKMSTIDFISNEFSNDIAKKQLESLQIKSMFDYPKSINMIKELTASIDFNEGIVLDFFSGSATTAHAVMQLNAEDGGKRKFIMVQVPELTNEKSEAYKAGYKNICEIGKERIRRAAKKIAEENPEAKFDGGFRVLKCDSSNMKEVYYNPAEYEPSLFSRLEDNIKEDRTPEDLLFQVMLDLGVLLSSKIEETTIAGKKVWGVEDNYLIACFDDNVTEEVITEIAKQKPYYFVMRDSSMANDSVATNFEQIFAAYSPDTVRKVL